MASLNLSTNGPSIKSSYQAIVNSSPTSSSSTTHAQWAVFAVQAPLLNAFQDNSTKESVLKVQTTGEGEFSDLLEELSEGRIQFAFVRVKDPNSGLPKNILIAWCGEGVPERTKGYFTSHLAAVSKILHGYHVQLTARSESDLDPDLVFEKVSNASGAKYSAGTSSSTTAGARPPPPSASKPAFTPTKFSNAQLSNPIVAARNRSNNDDGDGWGADAPQVTRTELQKVDSAYKPTKVNMSELTKQTEQKLPSAARSDLRHDETPSDVIKGGYQPIGKVDIAALRSQAKGSEDFRPTPVKGAYEPVGKVDIAAIRAKAQPQSSSSHEAANIQPEKISDTHHQASSTPQSRLTSMPKPKIANKFGSSSFGGTKPPVPAALGFAGSSVPAPAPVGAASRTFADKGGKTPAQLWAEKKAQQTGTPVGDTSNTLAAQPPTPTEKNSNGWKSGYTGKSWSVQAPTYQKTALQNANEEESDRHQDSGMGESPAGSVSALKDTFKESQPIAPSSRSPAPNSYQEKPALEVSKAPTSGFALPGLPSRPKEEDEDEKDDYEEEFRREPSPIRVAIPVARTQNPTLEAPEERHVPPPIPTQEIERHLPKETELVDDDETHDISRGASHMVADQVTSADQAADLTTPSNNASTGGKRAVVQYDYEKAEDNEIELLTGAYVVDIDMVDEDWWLGTNAQGERGLFPSNYVELVEEESAGQAQTQAPAPPPPPAQVSETVVQEPVEAQKPTATAIFDYEAAEDNELSFPDGAKITNVEFPDDDWWFGQYGQKAGLFPSNYVQLDA